MSGIVRTLEFRRTPTLPALSVLDPTASRPDSRLRFDQRILLLALAAGFPAALVALILLWTGDYTPESSVDAHGVRRRRLDRLLVQRPPPRRAAAADAVEPAGGAARKRLLDPRARRAAATTRSAR